MKKLVSLLLCLMLLGSAAMAETVLNGGENRGISFEKADLNDPIEGLSPVTGRLLSQVAADAPATGFAGQALTGRYMPIIVQIDNAASDTIPPPARRPDTVPLGAPSMLMSYMKRPCTVRGTPVSAFCSPT